MSLQDSVLVPNEPFQTAQAAIGSENDVQAISFEEFYRLYSRDVIRWCSHFFVLKNDLPDLVQEVWLKVHLNFQTYDASLGGHRGWLKRITVNTAIDKYRRWNRTLRPLVWIDEFPRFDIEDPRKSPQVSHADYEAVLHALKQLPIEFREMIELWFLAEHSYEDIVNITQLPLGSVKSRLHRAKKALVKLIANSGSVPGLRARGAQIVLEQLEVSFDDRHQIELPEVSRKKLGALAEEFDVDEQLF